MEVEITVTDNEAIMSTPMGSGLYNNSLIITKEAFIECYEKWIKPIKHGRWISKNGWVECSICHSEPPSESNIESDYCPNCGAKMDESEKNNG